MSDPTQPSIAPSTSANMATNTYALLLPSLSLFDSDPLLSLRNFYASFGSIVVWAPIKAMGRVVIVWDREVDGRRARRIAGQWEIERGNGSQGEGSRDGKANDSGRRDPGHKRTRSRGSLLIRLLPLPPTSEADLAKFRTQPSSSSSSAAFPLVNPSSYLVPPGQVRNFLISPPGSPPEGWEPITYEDAPNKDTLADDLMAALHELEVNGIGRRRRVGHGRTQSTDSLDDAEMLSGSEDGSAEVILQTDTGTVFQVQAPPEPELRADAPGSPAVGQPFAVSAHDEDDDISEYVTTSNGDRFAHHARMPFAAHQDEAMASGEDDGASDAGWRTPGVGERTFTGRPVPTARPPLPPGAE